MSRDNKDLLSTFPIFIVANRPELVMLVGLPGSGKSYYAEQHKDDYVIHSSDNMRKVMFGDESHSGDNYDVFNALHIEVRNSLRNGNSVIFDATNISRKRRISFLNTIKDFNVRKKAIIMATPYETCLQNNTKRERQVPDSIMNNYYKTFNIPYYNEGWDEVEVYYYDKTFHNLYGSIESFIDQTLSYSQNNAHHTKTLGNHCKSCGDLLVGKSVELQESGYLHDCGKPFCKTLVLKDDCESVSTHYYNHEYVGAYNSLFYSSKDERKKLDRAILIQYHMMPLLRPSVDYTDVLGKEMSEKLSSLVKADKESK